MPKYADKQCLEIGAKMQWLAQHGELSVSSRPVTITDDPRYIYRSRGWAIEFHMKRPVQMTMQMEDKDLNDALGHIMKFVKLNMEKPV